MRVLLLLANALCDERDVERIIIPALADMELETASSGHAPELTSKLSICALIARLSIGAHFARLGSGSWLAVGLATVTVLLSSAGLAGAAASPMRSQLVFLLVGLVLASIVVAQKPKRRSLASPAFSVLVGGLALFASVLGTEHGTARRWLEIGGLQVHLGAWLPLATLLALAFVFDTSIAESGPRRARSMVAGCVILSLALVLLVRMCDPLPIFQIALSTAVMIGALPAAVWRVRHRRWFAAFGVVGVSLAAGGLALWRAPRLEPVAWVEEPLRLIASNSSPLGGAIGALVVSSALVATCVAALLLARRIPSENLADRALGLSIVAAMGAQPLLAMTLNEGVHLIGYGGSGVVATLLSLAVLSALARKSVSDREKRSPPKMSTLTQQ